MTTWVLLSACVQEVAFVDTSEPEMDTGQVLPCELEPPDRELTVSQWEVDVGEVELAEPVTTTVDLSATGTEHVTITALEPVRGSEVTDLQLTGGCSTDGVILSGCTATLEITLTPQETGHFIFAVRVHSDDPWREQQTVIVTGSVPGEPTREYVSLYLRTEKRAIYEDETLELSARAVSPEGLEVDYVWAAEESGKRGDIEPQRDSDSTFSPSPVPRGECGVLSQLYIVATDADGNQTWDFDELAVYRRPPEPMEREHRYLGTCSTPGRHGVPALALIAAFALMMRRSEGRYVR